MFEVWQVVAVVVAACGALGVLAYFQQKKARARFDAEAVDLVGYLVQANNALFAPGSGDAPAQILISFDPAATPELMGRLAHRVADLKSNPGGVYAEVARLVQDETFNPAARNKLPTTFTGGPEVYSAGVLVQRRYLPNRRIELPYLHCRAVPGGEGVVVMRPYPAGGVDDLADLISDIR